MALLRILLVAITLAITPFAYALDIQPYSESALRDAQQTGKAVAIHFHASWCPTCRAQEKAFNAFKSDTQLAVLLLVADYDKERELKKKLGVRIQSTLIVYRGTKETARLAGETNTETLRTALESALH